MTAVDVLPSLPSHASHPLPPPPKLVFCDECGEPFYLSKHGESVGQELCGPKCNADRHKRRQRGYTRIIKALIEWRLSRTKSGLVDLCHLLDNGLIDEERKIRSRRDERIAAIKKEMARR